jgi:uncharacterized protein YjbI with pentapeptide repeats
MVSRFRSWLQQIKQHPVAVGVIGFVLVLVIVLIISVVWFNGTGFDGYNQVTTAHTLSGPSAGTVLRTEVYQPGKSLWDWLQLLIIPLVLAVGALLFNLATTRTEQKIALDKQREDLFQKYLDCMSDLLLKENLRSSAVDAEARKFARVRTITILFQLDARRIGYVFAFLREAGLMSNKPNSSIVSLSQADLSRANLSETDLSGANLNEAKLTAANLSRANLNGATLNGAIIDGANLNGTILSEATLDGALLNGTILSEATLYAAHLSAARLDGANLNGAILGRANLSRVNLSGADLRNADLSKANLTGAKLTAADLSGADLSKATVTEEQLKKAKSLKGATMPDGSKHI